MSRQLFDESEGIKDWRSTGRKRGRRTLIRLVAAGERKYACEICDYVPSIPWDQPSRGGDILDCDHRNKDYRDNDPANLRWLCRDCHKREDSQTGVGENPLGPDQHGYGLDMMDLDGDS